jgi:plasmid maintenance system antidote protein VapI
VSAIAEPLSDPGITPLELVPARPSGLGLPPGSVPLEPVRSAIRSYRAGVGSADRLLAAINRHGDALEGEIVRLAVAHLADMARTVTRLEALHARTADLFAQAAWLRSWPTDVDAPAVPLSIELDGCRFAIPVVLVQLRRAVALEERVALRAGPRRGRRRGAEASMAALADVGQTTTDVGEACGISRSTVWAMLNGHRPATPQLRRGLQQLIGADQAAIVLAGIPELPRARQPAGAAVRALQEAGIRTEDLAALIPVQPGTVRRWLRGSARLSPTLAAALEQLVDVDTAAEILALIPAG